MWGVKKIYKQKTFTDLVRQLVAGCANDVEKARAIFRWITVKNLNSLMFEDVSGGDTPLGKQCFCITYVQG